MYNENVICYNELIFGRFLVRVEDLGSILY